MTTPKTWLESYAPGPVVRRSASYEVPACNGQIVAVGSLGAAATITLPATPVLGQIVIIKRVGVFDFAITVDGNGATIEGASTLSVDDDYASVYLAWTGATWAAVAASVPVPAVYTLTTTDATATTIATVALETLRVYAITVEGVVVSAGGTRKAFQSVFRVTTESGAAVESGSMLETRDKLSTWVSSIDCTGLNVAIQMTGAAGTTIKWAVTVSTQSVAGFTPA